jgi:hypothetical protein
VPHLVNGKPGGGRREEEENWRFRWEEVGNGANGSGEKDKEDRELKAADNR